MFFNAPTLGLLLASPAFAAVLPLVARDVIKARQGGGGPFSGEATTFTGSAKSSCGAPLAAGAIAVALNGDWQTGISPNLAACGKQITITNNGNGLQGSIIAASSKGKTITATVQDTCPECDHTHIDLTTGAWNALTDNSKGGVVGITWSFVGGAPDGSGSGSTSTSPSPAAGAGQAVSKVAANKAGSPQTLNLANVPQSGDLATTLQQTGTGSGTNNTEQGTGSPSGVTEQSITGGGSTPNKSTTGTGSTSGSPSSSSGTPSSGGASGGTVGKFFQCGGSSWSGPTSCESGTTCQVQNQYYSQCL